MKRFQGTCNDGRGGGDGGNDDHDVEEDDVVRGKCNKYSIDN